MNSTIQLKNIREVCKVFDLSEKCVGKVVELRDKFIRNNNLSNCGITPKSFLAGLIYVSSTLCREVRTQKQIERGMSISTQTLRKAKDKIVTELRL